MLTEQFEPLGDISLGFVHVCYDGNLFGSRLKCAAEEARCECAFSCFFLFGSVVVRTLDLQDSFSR